MDAWTSVHLSAFGPWTSRGQAFFWFLQATFQPVARVQFGALLADSAWDMSSSEASTRDSQRSWPRRFARRLRREDGQAIVELALALPILLLLVTTILQFGAMYSKYETLVNAASAGARDLSLGVSGKNTSICDLAVAQTISSAKAAVNLPASDVTPSFPGSATGNDYCGSNPQTGVACTPYVYTVSCDTSGKETSGDEAQIAISYPYSLTIFGMHVMNVNLSTSAAQAVE